ncbi:MAG TPA: SulP family inorganic anion transporter [Solirubrobacterales bacterium]|nr:SulP family inorganic anion transporter [Solirubrobacterales bacterium]HMX71468.1 SulP family inorganic anion transporter [Solirubrobacterales bacterium]HNA23795.1 SulP family inorganic anion transporter [Solirubrobacterales bacterium]HNA43443.1 SulP family inorganic anion transporter [Solirubrobacterales bacterium]HNC91940.1 SulP family inorganic anion transporter [Solirubrobacterales bacterium]
MRLFPSIRPYRREWLRPDLMAALTVWAVLVPEALAYATIAGVSPIVGLYAAPGALLIYAALGSSRKLVTGGDAATAALSAAIVGGIVAGDSSAFVQTTAALAICVGLIAVMAGVARLGFVVNFISIPVLRGFIIGLALTIIAGQIPHLFGVESSNGNFFDRIWVFVTHLDQVDLPTVAIGLTSLAIILICKYRHPSAPGSLIAVGLGIAAVSLLDLGSDGVAIVGEIKSGLPSVALPNVGLQDLGDLVAGAVGLMLVGFAESLAAAKAYPDEDEELDADRELIGTGAANVGAGLFGGFVVTGSFSKTSINSESGARSQMAGIVVALMVVITMLFLTGLFEDLPEAALAAVVIAALIHAVDVVGLSELARIRDRGNRLNPANRPDFIAAVAALIGVTAFDILPGLFIGIVVSLVLLLYRSSRPHVTRLGELRAQPGHWGDLQRHANAVEVPQIVVLRLEAAIYFANSDEIRQAVIRSLAADTRAVVLDVETVPYIDVTAAYMLKALREELDQRQVRLVIARDVGQVEDMMRSTGLEVLLTDSYVSIDQAVDSVTAGIRSTSGDRPSGAATT